MTSVQTNQYFRNHRLTLFPAQGNDNFASVSAGGNLSYYMQNISFDPMNSYFNTNVLFDAGGIHENTISTSLPILEYLNHTDFKVSDLSKAFSSDYIREAGFEDPDETMTRHNWHKLLTSNYRLESYGGFFFKYLNTFFKEIAFENEGIGLLDRDDNCATMAPFRSLPLYGDKPNIMSTYYIDTDSRKSFLDYVKVDEETVYKGFSIESRLPFSVMLNIFNPEITSTLLLNDETLVQQMNYFPGVMFRALMLKYEIQDYDKCLNLEVVNELGTRFYLNSFLDKTKLPAFRLTNNKLILHQINPTQEDFDLLNTGNHLVFDQLRWQVTGGYSLIPSKIGSTRHLLTLSIEDVLSCIGMLFVSRDHPELMFNPGVETFQIQYGTDNLQTIPRFQPLDSIPEFWDEFLNALIKPNTNLHIRTGRELFDWFFSGDAATFHNIPTGTLLIEPWELSNEALTINVDGEEIAQNNLITKFLNEDVAAIPVDHILTKLSCVGSTPFLPNDYRVVENTNVSFGEQYECLYYFKTVDYPIDVCAESKKVPIVTPYRICAHPIDSTNNIVFAGICGDVSNNYIRNAPMWSIAQLPQLTSPYSMVGVHTRGMALARVWNIGGVPASYQVYGTPLHLNTDDGTTYDPSADPATYSKVGLQLKKNDTDISTNIMLIEDLTGDNYIPPGESKVVLVYIAEYSL